MEEKCSADIIIERVVGGSKFGGYAFKDRTFGSQYDETGNVGREYTV